MVFICYFGSFLCEIIREEFRLEELLLPRMSLKAVFSFANHFPRLSCMWLFAESYLKYLMGFVMSRSL